MKNKQIKEHLAHFSIAGFSFYDGAEIFKELKIGTLLDIELDEDNKYDPREVQINYKNQKLGFISRGENRIFYKLLKVGMKNITLRVQRISPDAEPEDQVGVVAHLVGEN